MALYPDRPRCCGKQGIGAPGWAASQATKESAERWRARLPDTDRELRGFALKFYTSEGNYDMAGNATPVFFIRDPMTFQHFGRAGSMMYSITQAITGTG